MLRVAITGATGLLGQALSKLLLDLDMQVYALIKDESHKSILDNRVHRVYGDICDRLDVENFVYTSKPDYFIHLAAQSQAYSSLQLPYQTFYTNVIGTLNSLEALRNYGQAKAIIVASSDKTYGQMIGPEYLETDPLNGTYPYEASKSNTDIIAKSYRTTYDMPIVTTRACNIYGIGDLNTGRLIPGILNAYKNNKPFIIRNGGRDVREYIHVNDVKNAYYCILLHIDKHGNMFDSFNIGSSEVFSTIEVVDIVDGYLDSNLKRTVEDGTRGEISVQKLNSDRLRSIGWYPAHNLRDSLVDIVPWYLQNI